ncbi:MAG: LPS assembly lipoprotein LptE [Thiobacillus sp.]
MNRRVFLTTLPAALLAGCGFELRRLDAIPFNALFIDAPGGHAAAQRLRNTLGSDRRMRLTASTNEAMAVLKLAPEDRIKTILSLSGAGRVTEYRLTYRLKFSVNGNDERVLAAPETIELTRDFTYDDAQVLAKSAEETLLYRSMEDDAATQILRRLRSIKPGNGG